MSNDDDSVCKRIVYDLTRPGHTKTITVDHHDYSWSGSMPCTGVYRCVHCGKIKE